MMLEFQKMNIQGNQQSRRKFVLDILPEIYRNVKIKFGIVYLDSENIDEVVVNESNDKVTGDTTYYCHEYKKPYRRKSNFDKHMLSKHGSIKNISKNEKSDRTKENCPTCETPKGKGKAISCTKCMINYHVECVVGVKEKLDGYKTGKVDFECEDCFMELR